MLVVSSLPWWQLWRQQLHVLVLELQLVVLVLIVIASGCCCGCRRRRRMVVGLQQCNVRHIGARRGRT